MSERPQSDQAWADVRARRRWVASFRRAVAGGLESLSALVSAETGKPAWESVTADVLPLLVACRWLERRGPRLLRDRPVPGSFASLGTRVTERRLPAGRIAIIATWNYPVQLLGIQMVQALFAGNRVTVKPSERAPGSQRELCRLAHEAGLPDGVLEVYDHDREAGARLLAERRFDHVIFTGSTPVGIAVARACTETLTPCTLELSGRDSAFVLADADTGIAARSIWNAVTMNSGQTCMAPRRVLVDRTVAESFERTLAELAERAQARALISEDEARRVRGLVRDAASRGGRPSVPFDSDDGRLLRPVVVFDCPPDAPLVDGRHFGPAVAVVPVSTLEEALAVHARCDQHLATSVFTRNRAKADHLIGRLGSTTVTVNDCVVPVGHPGVSIGGRALSGWGVSRGAQGLLAMTRPVFITRTGSLLRPPVGTPTPAMQRWLPRAVRAVFGGRTGARPMSAPGESEHRPSSNPLSVTRTPHPGRAPGGSGTHAHV